MLPDSIHSQITALLKEYACEVLGSLNHLLLQDFAHYSSASQGSVIWVGSSYFDRHIKEFENIIKVNCIVTDNRKTCEKFSYDVCILTDRPQLIFTLLHKIAKSTSDNGFIHPTAIIHRDAEVHPSVYVGPFTHIGKSIVKRGTYITGNVFIKDNVTIGENCKIDAGVVIGVDGTGHQKDRHGEWVQFPQIGGTIISDNVEIGANTYITKGALKNTFIGRGAVIGLDCGIGHNVCIEENALIIAKAIVGGSSTVKANAIIGMCAIIRDGIVIGNNSVIGMGAIVTKNVPDNEVWFGSPAKRKD